MDRWIGKVAVVTGAGCGIGRATTRALVKAGMNVIGLDRREDRLEKLSKEFKELKDIKGSFHFARCDIRKEGDVLKAFKIVEKKFGGLDVLVNNAGIVLDGVLTDGKAETFRTILEVNVLGAAICTREGMKSIRKRNNEGHIFYINSILGLDASAQMENINIYPASKFALHAISESLKDNIFMNKDNIRVTGIYPGLVETEFLFNLGLGAEVFEQLPHVKSEEIANCVLFALSAPPKTQVSRIVISPLHGQL